MGSRLSGLGSALYDSKRKQFLGRDGAGWGKLGVFYFFFYLGLAGFFCAMLAVFMALSPRDRPRYYSESSRMRTRSYALSPGLGFRPQPEVDKNLVYVDKNLPKDETSIYVKNLDYYLNVYYWKKDTVEKKVDEQANENDYVGNDFTTEKFIINRPGDCISENEYGFRTGQPCVLVKMNKIVGFKPRPGGNPAGCEQKSDAVAVHCYGEYPADVDNIGNITYISENEQNNQCGSLKTKWFPYTGKKNRRDVYQAPYVWVQFTKAKPNVLINVLCRIYGQNIDFDKKTGRALTRFQLYIKDIKDKSKGGSSSSAGQL